MPHDHDHHHHSHAPSFEHGNNNAFIVGICLNAAFVVAEVIGGILYNSIVLLSDAGHNASDVASLVLSLVAFKMAEKKSSAVYTYGYKKTTVLAALTNAVIIFIVIGILGYESVTRLLRPERVQGGIIAWIAGFGILVNGISALLFFRNRKKELNVKAAYVHMLTDAMVSAGVVITGVMIAYTGWSWLDPAVGLLIVAIILAGGWRLLRDSFKMTIDAVPSGIDLDKIKKVILEVTGVKQVGHVHVWPLSTTENALTAHVAVDEKLNFDQKLTVIANIRHELLHHNIHHSTIELQKVIE